MKVVFISGPFRGESYWQQEKNVRRAEALALKVWQLGAACICPHTNTRYFQGAAPDEVWLEGDLEMMKRCDAVFMTPDWVVSEGASKERHVALKHGIPVFYKLDVLAKWLRSNGAATTKR